MSGLRIEHERVGVLVADEAEILRFAGLPGFAHARRFVVRTHQRGQSLGWLVCLDDPRLALVIANPWHFFPDYAPRIPGATLAGLGAKALEACEIVAVATLGEGVISLNLAAPILIHKEQRRGAQVILADDTWPVRARVATGTAPPAP